MATSTNPFATLITPDMLEAQRAQAVQERYAGADPFVRMAAEAGYKLGKNSRAQGYGLTEEDIKAKRNQNVMSSAEQKYAELIKSGKMDAEEAQAAVLEEAIAGFSANGSWEQALALTQPLNAIRSQQLERRKLKAEAAFQESRPDIEAMKADASLIKAEAAVQQAEAAASRAQTANDRAQTQMALDTARATLAMVQASVGGFRPPSGDGGGGEGQGGGGTVYDKKRRQGVNQQLLSAASAADLMAQIREIGIADPRALTRAGGVMTSIATISESTKALMRQEGYDPEADARKYSETIKANISDQQLQSLVTDLAFAFARVRDPGGRLSNQDVENAVKIVSGAGSPQARMAVLDRAFANLHKQTKNAVEISRSEGYAPTPEAESIYARSMALYGEKVKPGDSKSPPLNLLNSDGSNTAFKNGQVWKLENGKAVRVK